MTTHSLTKVLFAVAASATLALPSHAQEQAAADIGACEVTSQSETIRIMVCDPVPEDAELARVGRLSCEGQLPCGAWFYADAAAAPATAPENHDGLTRSQVVNSLGVYTAEDSSLIRLTPVTEDANDQK